MALGEKEEALIALSRAEKLSLETAYSDDKLFLQNLKDAILRRLAEVGAAEESNEILRRLLQRHQERQAEEAVSVLPAPSKVADAPQDYAPLNRQDMSVHLNKLVVN